MPAIAFGLKESSRPLSKVVKTNLPQKRKALFDADSENEEDAEGTNSSRLGGPKATSKPAKMKLKPILDDKSVGSIDRPSYNVTDTARKSPKTLDIGSLGSSSKKAVSSNGVQRYDNLSAMRTAKLHDEEASKLDASVYDYDAVYDTFHTKPTKSKASDDSTVPKYMTHLMASAETRKRDQLRAKEKLLQKERENEGDEFAGKEKFVTGAYKKAQEEMRKMEEDEKRKEEEEEARRKRGGGMEAFNRGLLKKEEERQKMIEDAAEQVRLRKEKGEEVNDVTEEESDNERQLAQKLNAQGARVAMNDEGEVLDKRQLLGAGLNIAPKKKVEATQANKKSEQGKPQEWHRTAQAQDARASQRERQSRMVERQIEEMSLKQQEAEQAEVREIEEKNKSKVTDDAKLSAKERFLQRKREREAAAAAKG